MQHTDQIQALSEFLLEYATTLMGAGVHTNRAVRNISRIAAAYGYSADMTIFQRNITMSLICKDDETLRRTSVRKLKPLAFNLNLIQQLSELSWLPVDNNVSIAEMEQAFRSMVRTKRFSRWTDLLLVSVGNAAFCRLFNGDLWAMLTVFAATMLGFLAKLVDFLLTAVENRLGSFALFLKILEFGVLGFHFLLELLIFCFVGFADFYEFSFDVFHFGHVGCY